MVHKPTHKSVASKEPEWSSVLAALNHNDRIDIKALGEAYGKPRKIQEGVSAEEVRAQLLQLAPGKHPLVGPLLLDLADKMRD